MEKGDLLVLVSVISVIISLFAAGVTYLSIDKLISAFSGYVSTGEVNLTVESSASINFTTRAINWGSGRVNSDVTAASLNTFETGNVTGGNWTLATAGGLRIENNGQTNVTLNLTVGKNASQFIGGNNPVYEWNLTAVEANSCRKADQINTQGRMNAFYQANTTPATAFGGLGCAVFSYIATADALRLDFNLTIPENSLTGALGDVITATVTAI